MSQPEEIVVRVVRGTCADEETCPAVTRAEHDEQWRPPTSPDTWRASPSAERKQPWLDRLRSERERGLQRSRVRLVTHAVTDYTRFECEWGYAPNAEAGEQVLILDAGAAAGTDAAVERLKACGDFWLIDDAHVVVMHYGPDGQFVGAERAEDVARYRAIAQLARQPAEPFAAWWARHEEYHRNPKVA